MLHTDKTEKPITKVVKIVYEIDGHQYEAVPVPADAAIAAIGTAGACTGLSEPCSGDYECINGKRWRCMLNHATKRCQWYETTEPC
jgi:hypothetical protein